MPTTMTAELSNSSWHPAFMPNSSADSSTKAESPQHHLETSAIQDTLEPMQHLEYSPKQAPTPSPNPQNDKQSLGDNENEGALAGLGGTATQPSDHASEGLDGKDSNSYQNSEEVPDVEQQSPASKSPTTENKHLSTASFARTVSHDVSWAEDETSDGEWNPQKRDTDPFKFMAESDRTNSFPAVPPAHEPIAEHLDQPITPNPAEEIIHNIEQEPRDLFADEPEVGDADFFTQEVESTGWDSNEPGAEQGESTTTHFGQSYGGDLHEAGGVESQARYDEGVPLVETLDQYRGVVPGHDAGEAPEFIGHQPSFVGESMDNGEDVDFFSQVSKQMGEGDREAAVPVPHTLKRKSTTQVLDSIDFEPHAGANDVPKDDQCFGQANKDNETLGQTLEADSGDSDLAAKWQAALAEDEFLGDDDDLLNDEKGHENQGVDPATFFGSDDEGFLEEIDDQAEVNEDYPNAPSKQLNGSAIETTTLENAGIRPGSSSNSRYMPQNLTTATPAHHHPYAPATLSQIDLSRPNSTSTISQPYLPAPRYGGFQAQPVQQPPRPELPKAQSFADRSKGGYTSPYDLPMEVVKPRKRTSMQQMSRNATSLMPLAPPPRTASANIVAPPPRTSTSSLSPPQTSHSDYSSQTQPSGFLVSPVGPPPPKPKPVQHGFFEDLPMTSRPTATRVSTRSQLSPNESTPPPPAAPQGLPSRFHGIQHSMHGGTASNPMSSPPSHDLVAPERVNPYASIPPSNVLPAVQASRYSPAPSQLSGETTLPPAQARYSPVPPPQQHSIPSASALPPIQPPLPFAHQPRTSSPLAHFERGPSLRSPQATNGDFFHYRRNSSPPHDAIQSHPLPYAREVDEVDHDRHGRSNQVEPHKAAPSQYGQIPSPARARRNTRTPPRSQATLRKTTSSPTKRAASNYVPQKSYGPPSSVAPPVRSQTQSPGAALSGPRLEMIPSSPYPRPASVEVPLSPRINDSGFTTLPPRPTVGRPRGHSQALNYVTPVDGRELDPLQRWKGCPVFVWGVGGSFVTSFPKDVPRYGAGQTVPWIMRSLGEVKIRNIKDLDHSEERLTSFPGPLKGKTKKKDVLAWLASSIQSLERNALYLRATSQLSHEDKRIEERVLLWKILRVFIEHDGILEGNVAVEKAVRGVLSPNADEVSQTGQLYATGADLSGISQSTSTTARTDSVGPAAVDQLRKHLLQGEREKAVWEAVDKRLWAHAMLISNTVSKELYRQVAQEFVQKEVKNVGDNTEPLAALYEIFAGNFEESIDELVPPSARAGYQLVSTSKEVGSSKDALDGLDRWRETLGLVLSNRSTDDSQALNALGKLLAGYGRAEAAHICFMFARSYSIFSGIDDPTSSIVLLGSDHLRQPYDFDKDIEAILLSEVYEFGLSLAGTSNASSFVPHLAVYKLQHATALAEYGHRDKALQYCEMIASSITSQTRRSPYHHPLLVASLDDLSKRLKQTPKDGSSSWISKPSIDKVSGSVWATFNKFVAGDEAETTESTTPGSVSEVGPFARIAGNTPAMSREASHSDMYGTYNTAHMSGTHGPMVRTSSRYTPGGSYTPPNHEPQTASSAGSQPRSSFEGRRSDEVRRGPYELQRQMSDYRPTSQSINHATDYRSQHMQYTPPSSYAPHDDSISPYTRNEPSVPIPPAPSYEQPAVKTFEEHSENPSSASRLSQAGRYDGYEQPTSNGYEAPMSEAYEPPTSHAYNPPTTSSGYEPPSYQPHDEPESPIETRPKNKTFMDDDDDDIPGLRAPPAAAAPEKTKTEKDREVEEAFRRAAEEDGKLAHWHALKPANVFHSQEGPKPTISTQKRLAGRMVRRQERNISWTLRTAQQAHQSQAR